VQLSRGIAHDAEGTFALDSTAFAFKDAVDPAAETKWAAIYSIVKCEVRALSSTKPTYVDTVWLATVDGQKDAATAIAQQPEGIAGAPDQQIVLFQLQFGAKLL